MTTSKPVVTIFEAYGSGASVVGPRVAEALGVPWIPQRYSSEDIEDAADRPAREDGFLSRVLATLGRSAATADAGVIAATMDMLDVEDAIRAMKARVADGGVVLGRNGTVILADEPNVLHVKLDGPVEQRIARAAAEAGIDLARARARQAREDAARAEMSRRLFNWDPRHNDRFDLVVNTSHLSPDMVVDLILAAYRLKTGG